MDPWKLGNLDRSLPVWTPPFIDQKAKSKTGFSFAKAQMKNLLKSKLILDLTSLHNLQNCPLER
jgi:hypothetical protein